MIAKASEAIAVDAREVGLVGRHARLELVFAVRRGQTVLAHAYAEPPFRVGRPFLEADGVRMILAWSAPGIFGGDRLTQHVQVETGARVHLMSQSALQVHPTATAAMANLDTTYHVAGGSVLSCEWDPVIPFAGSRFTQRIELHLDEGAALLWSDALMSGRDARGERWRFDIFDHQLKVTRSGRLDYLERYRLTPARAVEQPWVASGAAYLGTVLVSGRPTPPDLGSLQHELTRTEGLRAAVDSLDRELTLVRLMGDKGSAFHAARVRARSALWA